MHVIVRANRTTPARKSLAGVALLEFHIVALLGLLPFFMGVLQTAVLLAGRNVLNHATYAAVRAGALEQASRPVMVAALARGLLPLYIRSSEELTAQNVAAAASAAYVRSYADTLLFARLQIVNPSPAAYEDFGEPASGGEVIRSDSLEHRGIGKGPRSGLSIQEANILDIRVRYCHPLIFPIIDRLLLATLRRMDLSAENQLCYAAGRVPISARGVIHMQSDARRS